MIKQTSEVGYLPDNIPCRYWGEKKDARANILLVHGLGAHSGWFEPLASELAARSFYCLSYDQIGFGRRQNAEFHSRKQWLSDLTDSYEYLRTTNSGIPTIILGNSMGALVALRAVNYTWPSGLVLLSPGFEGNPELFSTGYKINGITRALLSPDSVLELPYGVQDITQNLDARRWTQEDPLRRFDITARMAGELLKLTMDAQSLVHEIFCPIFAATAGIDRIVVNEATRKALQRLKAPSFTLEHYQQSWHDLVFELDYNNLLDDLCRWAANLENISTARALKEVRPMEQIQ